MSNQVIPNFSRDNNDGAKARTSSTCILGKVLSAATAGAITVPTNGTGKPANKVILSWDGSTPLYVDLNGGTAAVPTTTTQASAPCSEILQQDAPIESRTFSLTGVTSISLFSTPGCAVSAAFFI